MYVVDTNVWLERLLERRESENVGKWLGAVESSDLCITDFAFHSLGVILVSLNKTGVLTQFVQDTSLEGDVRLVRLEPEDTARHIEVMTQFRLDYDDAYQYVAAETFDLILVSLDSDFDRTERGRVTPGALLAEIGADSQEG